MLLPLCASLALAAPPAEKPIKPLPTLSKEPKLDGSPKDLAQAVEFKLPESAEGSSAKLTKLKAAFRKDTLYVSLNVEDDKYVAGDHLDLSLFFPESGTTSHGVVYRFTNEGLQPAPADIGAPEFAQAMVKTNLSATPTGYAIVAAIPARALPRFQAFKQLGLSICADYTDVDIAGGEASKLTTCAMNEMVGGPTRIPDELRKTLKLTPSSNVEGIEPREHGWLGYSKLHYPTWAEGDEALTPQSLGQLIAGDDALEPKSVALPIPEKLFLPDNRPIFTVLTGRNPYIKDKCLEDAELRLAMYVVKDKVANRVLEWPAANCKLGRAMRFELSPEGELQIGYTNGGTQHFVWTAEHFERSELGRATP